jgi:hypothetical protein
MSAVAKLAAPEADVAAPGPLLPIGEIGGAPLNLDLARLLHGRCLVQGSSGAGKSRTLRRIIEEAFEYVTVMIVDPEGEFSNLAEHIGATTLIACDMAADGLTAAAMRARHHRLPLHLDLTDLAPDERIVKAAAFFAGVMGAPKEDWANTCLVAIDEAHLLAPHLASSARDAETRRLGVSSLTELCSRGRKRGVGAIIATPRLATLAGSVLSTLQNAMIGLNVFDRDVTRAADILGFSLEQARGLRRLSPGEFFVVGPALSWSPSRARIGPSVTVHAGASPQILGPSDVDTATAGELLDLAALREVPGARQAVMQRGGRALDAFLMDPAGATAARIVEALAAIAPNATTATDLGRHLALEADRVDAGLDLLSALGCVDTMPRAEMRLARLASRLRLRAADIPVVALS